MQLKELGGGPRVEEIEEMGKEYSKEGTSPITAARPERVGGEEADVRKRKKG